MKEKYNKVSFSNRSLMNNMITEQEYPTLSGNFIGLKTSELKLKHCQNSLTWRRKRAGIPTEVTLAKVYRA